MFGKFNERLSALKLGLRVSRRGISHHLRMPRKAPVHVTQLRCSHGSWGAGELLEECNVIILILDLIPQKDDTPLKFA